MTAGLLNITDQGHFGRGFSVSGQPRGMVMADLNADGFADIALLTSDNNAGDPPDWGLLRVVTASNPDDVDDGLSVSAGIGPNLINFTLPISIAAGDFDGDGKREIVLVQTLDGQSAQIVLNIYEILTTQDGKIAPQALRQAASVTVPSPAGDVIWSVQVLAGDFDGVVNLATGLPVDEIVLVVNNGNQLTLQTFRVSTQSTSPLTFALTLATTFVSADTVYTNGETQGDPLFAAAGRLEWFNPAEQVVVAYTASDANQQTFWYPVAVFTLDSDLGITQASSIITGFGNAGLALGNFDQDLGLNSPPNLEIARVLESGVTAAPYVEILRVDPTNGFALSVASNTLVPALGPALAGAQGLVAGDAQGRSLLLGPPNKVTITNYQQPEIILDAPPMHVASAARASRTPPPMPSWRNCGGSGAASACRLARA
jgi:hypothetical protein